MKFSKWILFSIIGIFIIMGCSLDETSPSVQPSISNVIISPDSIGIGVVANISAIIYDADGTISEVILNYGVESLDSLKSMNLGDENSYSAEIGPFSENYTIMYQIEATDNDNGTTEYSSSFTIGSTQPEGQSLYINEFLASNDTANEDEFGGFDDWFELYNDTEAAIDIGGMYVTDALSDLTKWQIPDTDPTLTTIQPGDFLLIWADSEPDQGLLHVDFKLSSGGEEIAITDVDGVTIIDSYTFGGQTTDVSEGRMPDAGTTWQFFDTPTPGTSNQ